MRCDVEAVLVHVYHLEVHALDVLPRDARAVRHRLEGVVAHGHEQRHRCDVQLPVEAARGDALRRKERALAWIQDFGLEEGAIEAGAELDDELDGVGRRVVDVDRVDSPRGARG